MFAAANLLVKPLEHRGRWGLKVFTVRGEDTESSAERRRFSSGLRRLTENNIADLESFSDGGQLRAGDFDLASGHVRRLFGVERVGDAAHHEHVQLLAASPIFLLLLRPLALRAAAPGFLADAAAVRRRQRRARAGRTDAVGTRRVRPGGGGGRSRRGADAVEASGHRAAAAAAAADPEDRSGERGRAGCRSGCVTTDVITVATTKPQRPRRR